MWEDNSIYVGRQLRVCGKTTPCKCCYATLCMCYYTTLCVWETNLCICYYTTLSMWVDNSVYILLYKSVYMGRQRCVCGEVALCMHDCRNQWLWRDNSVCVWCHTALRVWYYTNLCMWGDNSVCVTLQVCVCVTILI